MESSPHTKSFRVIIAGGGISGLALANCLELANIDYLLLEGRDSLTPFIGAGVCLSSGSGPVLDQLGVRQKIFDRIAPLRYFGLHSPDGDYLDAPLTGMLLNQTRSGYSRGFIERGEVLTLLYNNLPNTSKQSKLFTNKRISKIDHTHHAVTVHCRDGSVYCGDILAGADGIHSQARSEMWRASNETDGVIPMSEQKPLNAVFGCLFGISRLIDGFNPSYFEYIPDQGHSIMWAVGKDKIFWYVYYTLPKVVTAGEVKFTDADAENLATSVADCPVMPNGTHCFRDFWESRLTATLLPMEMGEYRHTTWGRFAMLGDAVHKQTVSAGQGANLCIESAAVLTNTIKRLLDENAGHQPSLGQIQTALVNGYQDSRAARVSAYVEAVNEHTALLCKYNLPLKIMQDYVLPWLPSDFGNNFYCDLEVGADMLDFIPPPKATFAATMPYNKYLGAGHRENLLRRATWALPFLGLFGFALIKMDPKNAVPDFIQIVETGQITWNSGIQPIYSNFYGLKQLDDFALITTTFFSGWTLGFDTVGSWQVFTFLVDFGTLYVILLIEACRCANSFSLARLPVLWGLLAQKFGIGLVGQLYFFFHYLGAQMDNYKALDMRLTDLQYVRGIFPAMAGFYVPLLMSIAAPISPATRYYWGWIWQPFPLWVAMGQYVLAKTGFFKSTLSQDRLSAPIRDMPTIRYTVWLCAAISASVWLYTITSAPFSVLREFAPAWDIPSGIWPCARNFMAWDHVLTFASALLWLGLLFKDLKAWEKTHVSWHTLCILAVTTCAIAGPGATVGLGWLWREELLAVKGMKGALIEDSWKAAEKATVVKRNGSPKH